MAGTPAGPRMIDKVIARLQRSVQERQQIESIVEGIVDPYKDRSEGCLRFVWEDAEFEGWKLTIKIKLHGLHMLAVFREKTSKVTIALTPYGSAQRIAHEQGCDISACLIHEISKYKFDSLMLRMEEDALMDSDYDVEQES